MHEMWAFVLGEFEIYQTAAKMSRKTVANRYECLCMLAKMSGRGPEEVTLRDLQIMLSRKHYRTGEQISGGTMQSERSYFQTFFKWMKAEGLRPDDPSERLAKVKLGRRRPRPLRLAQIERMLNSGARSRTQDLITIAALSGLRLGEIVAIRGEDVDIEGGTVFSVRKGGVEQAVAIHPKLIEIAQRYPSRGWWFPSYESNKQFPNGGGHILMKSASACVTRAIRNAGVTERRITGHSLRHFFASTLIANGASVRVVQEMMGHSSLDTTQLYAEVTDQQMQDAVRLLPDVTQPVAPVTPIPFPVMPPEIGTPLAA